MDRPLRLLPICVAVASACLAAPAVAAAGTFSNPAPVTVNDAVPATPYPSQIVVSGEGTVGDVNVTLGGMSHTVPDDIDVLLVGPTGESVVVMSDAGLLPQAVDLTFTFDDEAAGLLPETGELVSGTYRPSNWAQETRLCEEPLDSTTDAFPTPAPLGPYGAALSAFDGTNANGTWSLYVVDDCGEDVGSISGGWSLEITTDNGGSGGGGGPTPAQKLSELSGLVGTLGLDKGTGTALNAKLRAALAAVTAGDKASACDSLQAFLNQVKAQTGKKLTSQQATELTDSAVAVRTSLGC